MNISPISLMNFSTTGITKNNAKPASNMISGTNLAPLAKDTVSFSATPETNIKLKAAIHREDYEEVLKELDYDAEKDPATGKLYVSEYSQPDEDTTFEDYGINEQRLFNSIKQFEGETYMQNSSVVKLGDQNFEFLNIEDSKVKDLGHAKINVLVLNPEQVKDLNFKNAQINDLYIVEKDETGDKIGKLINQIDGELYYFPDAEKIYKLEQTEI